MTQLDDWFTQLRTWLLANPMPAPAAPTPTPTPSTQTAPNNGKLVLWDSFATLDSDRWVVGRSSAYPNMGPTNPSDNKLDYLIVPGTSAPGTYAFGPDGLTITAKPYGSSGYWSTGLLTTEGSKDGFSVKAGDYVEVDCTLPSGMGAWPALWTWRNGGSEIDTFEFHPDNPNLLEFSNHVRSAYTYWSSPSMAGPGQRVRIGTWYGAGNSAWFVNGSSVWSDGTGVGSTWAASLILNLSISSGKYHPKPSGTSPIDFTVHSLGVWR